LDAAVGEMRLDGGISSGLLALKGLPVIALGGWAAILGLARSGKIKGPEKFLGLILGLWSRSTKADVKSMQL